MEKERTEKTAVKETGTTQAVPTAGERSAAAQIDSITASFNEGSYDRVDEMADLGEPALPKLYEMLSSEEPDERWASSYALSRIAFKVGPERQQEIIAHLEPALNDGDPSVRQTAAGVLTALGVKDGIPVLMEYLRSDETYYMSDPPEPLSEYSYDVLSYYTGKDYGDDITSWENWWAENRDRLFWDASKGEYGGYITR